MLILIRARLQYATAFSDKATFYNTSQLNRYNSYYWSVETSTVKLITFGNANASGIITCKPYNSKST